MTSENGNDSRQQVKKLEERWGKQTLDVKGWTGIPSLLLERQQMLKIDPVDMNILLVLLSHWWSKEKMPFPSKGRIAEIINRDVGTVRRHIKKLEDNGLVNREERFQANGNGQTSNIYRLDGLVSRLAKEAEQEAREQKERDEADSAKRRGRPTKKQSETNV